MRKLIAIAAALGFLATTGLSTLAAPATNSAANSYEVAPATKKTTKKHVKKKLAKQKENDQKM